MTEPILKTADSNQMKPKLNSFKLIENNIQNKKRNYKSKSITRLLSNTPASTVSTNLRAKKAKPITKTSRIKNNVQAILSTSSAHGLNRLFTTKRILFRIMWLNFFICSASFGIYMVSNSVYDYFKYEVVTQMRIIQEAPTQFPTITFYNLKNNQDNLTLNDVLLSCTFNSKSCDDSDFETKADKAGNVY